MCACSCACPPSTVSAVPASCAQFYFSPGDTGFKVWDTAYGKVGIAICWDQWFPEAARSLALQGAEVSARQLSQLLWRSPCWLTVLPVVFIYMQAQRSALLSPNKHMPLMNG